jgi:hypothetical protein
MEEIFMKKTRIMNWLVSIVIVSSLFFQSTSLSAEASGVCGGIQTRGVVGEIEVFELLPGHSWTVQESVVSNCTEPGYTKYACPCNYVYYERTESLGHDMINGTCSRCGLVETNAGYFTWSLNSGGDSYTVTGLTTAGKGLSELVIPGTYNGKPVTHIKNGTAAVYNTYFTYHNYKLTSVTIPDSVVEIGDYAFTGAAYLQTIELGENIKRIGKSVFVGAAITEIDLPDGLVEIGEYAFSSNKNLTEIKIPENIVKLSDCLFFACYSLANIYLPNGLKEIGTQTFSACIAIKEIEIPDSVTIIGNNAFRNCTGIKNINLPESLVKIDVGAFLFCSGLEEIILPSNVQIIGSNVFNACSSLKKAYIPSSVTTILADIGGSPSGIFSGSNNLEIYCGVASKPSGWTPNWDTSSFNANYGNPTVYKNIIKHNPTWGVTRSQYDALP